MQHEIRTKDKLLHENGSLKHRGFSKTPMLEYNPENIKVYPFSFINRLRLKEWDYYGVIARDFFFSATVSNIGYAGVMFVYFIDFQNKSMKEETLLIPFGKGCRLPRSSESGDIHFHHKDVRISFVRQKDSRHITVDWPGFNRGEGISADITAHQPPTTESIIVSTPIGKKRFYYNQKTNCMPTEGTIAVGEREYHITCKDSLTTLDWGRGVWEYSSFWNWASASGFLPTGATMGLNLGMGFGDLSFATENCFFIDGKMTKLDRVQFTYDTSNYLKPWYFSSNDGKLELTFQPFFDRVAGTNIVIIKSKVHQLFGTYSGTVMTDAGEKIPVQGLIGWAEEHKARW